MKIRRILSLALVVVVINCIITFNVTADNSRDNFGDFEDYTRSTLGDMLLLDGFQTGDSYKLSNAFTVYNFDTNTIVDKIVGTTFNPISATVANALASFFHVDFGFSGFTLGATYAARFADYTGTMLVIMTSINGLVSLVAPTSVLLVTGLSMYDVSYKEWLKNIWKFAVILLVLLLILFSVMAYV